MNPAQLLAHFDRISDAPDAIPRLRQTILNLAVRGKLVPQDSREEPVAQLLQQIDHERNILAKEDRRANADRMELLAGEWRWDVPPTWDWRGVADLALFIDYRGKTPTKTDSGIRLITAKNVRRGQVNPDPEEFITEGTYRAWMTRGLPRRGDILFTTEAPMGNAAVVRLDGKFGLAQRVINFRLYGDLDSDFIVLQLLSEPFQSILDKTATGLTAKGIKAAKLKRLPLAVPPLAEQHRIVAKVDELMALCDRLEAAQAERESRRDQLVVSSLSRLNNGSDPDAFRNHARFYFNHLPRLTTRPKDVKNLRGTMLNLAFRGRLTFPGRGTGGVGETVQEFIRSVESSRKKSWDDKQSTGSGRKYPPPIDFDRENLPMIHDSWIWTSADAVCSQITDGEHIQPRYQAEGLPMLTAKHVREGFVTFEDSELISESDFKKCVARCKPEQGDILIVSVGATTGRAAIVSQPRPFALVRSVLLLKPLISPTYFLRWLQSPWCLAWMRQASEASAQPHLYIGDTKRMPIPLPPLAEQHRIVAKVDELMALCDRLEAQLTTTQTESRRLLEAVLHEALAPAV